jgi:hypothetical protein
MELRLSCSRSFVVVVIVLIAITFVAANNSHIIIIPSYDISLGGKVQEWTNAKDNVKIEFVYSPEKPIIDTFTALNFSIQNLKSGEHINDFTARVVVTNGQRLFKFENITVPDGDFSVKYLCPDDGTHQVILRLNLKHSVELASFHVFVPHQSPPGLLNNGGDTINIIVAIGLIVAVGLITIVILKRR